MKKLNQKFLTVLLGLMMVGQGWAMSGSSTEASQGEFPSGYDYSFTTTGTTVNISFTENSTRDGLVAYLWNRTGGFQETQMTVSGRTATIALTNQTAGTTLKLACKFAYVGGMAVTKDFEYTVEGGDTPTPPTPTTGIDWSKISWVAASNDKFKVGADASLGEQMPNEVVNVQQPGFATKSGIYMTFPGDVSECTHKGGIQGGGLCLYIDQFTAKETKVTVTYAGGSRTFTIYYADGSEPASDLEDPNLTITAPTANPFELALNATQQIAWTSSNTATPTFTSSNPAAVEVSADGLITAKAIGSATITVKQEETDTYQESTQTITVTVPGDKSKNTECSGWNNDIWASQGGYTYDFSTEGDNVVLKFTAIGNLPTGLVPAPQMCFLRKNGGDGIENGGSVSGKTITFTIAKSILTRDDKLYLFDDNTIHFKTYFVYGGVDQTGVYIYTVGEDCQPHAVTGVSIPETLNLTVGDSQTLTATITPSNASNKNVSWEITEGTDYAEVDATGKVTAKAEGTATVKVTTEDGGFTDECTVTVTAAPVITNPYCEKEVGHFLDPSADPNSFILLSIGSDGEGHTIVNIKQDAAKNTQKFDYLQVSGLASTGGDVATGGVTEMAVKFATPTPDVNGDITLEILWSTVDWPGRWMVQNLKVPATATCASAVVPEVPEAEVKTYYGYLKHAEKGVYVGYSITRNKDNTLTFDAKIDSETNIATAYVNVEGSELSLVKAGDVYSAKTSATFIEGASFVNTYFHFVLEGVSNTADIAVTNYTVGASNDPVTFPTEKVTLDKANLSFGVGDADQTLTARVYPNFATNTTVAWTTDAEGVATVSNGAVHPVGAGDATITATCEGKTATCAVNVVAALEDASYYGTGSFKTPVDNSYVAYNYNFTRKANHEVVLTVVFERDVTDYITSDNFQFFENNTMRKMTYAAATHTATYSFGNKTDGSEIVNFYFRFVLTSGGLGETSPFTYTVGSTNEQPNKLIAINEVLANTLTDGEFVDALLGRTFIADEANYTLCLPFDMTADQCLDAFGSNYKLWELGVAYMKTPDVMYLPFSEVTSIEAGKPYLFCPATTVENPTIEGVTINAADPASIGNAWAKMTGIYSPYELPIENNYVLGPDNWLYQSDGTQMYGLRCYFTFGSAAPANVRARAIFHDTDVVTDLETIEDAQHAMPNGKYVIDGQFVIIRNGKQYNAVGQAR